MGCIWHFTFDEFQNARMRVGRMQAKVYQEDNALTQLKKAQSQVDSSKQNYQMASNANQKEIALMNWQNGLDQLSQIPEGTLASKMAKAQFNPAERDLSKLSGRMAGNEQTNIRIQSAKQFG
jgi:hypothetical protein